MKETDQGNKFPRNIGIAADHGGFELKNQLLKLLDKTEYVVTDFGALEFQPEDDYPDYVIPLARAVADGSIDRGLAVCGSGVGACIAANKIHGVRACLINETYSAHQGVEHDNMNLLCLGGRVLGPSLAEELVKTFLSASFNGAERHQRRLNKITALEHK